jgi:hypothetical protein
MSKEAIDRTNEICALIEAAIRTGKAESLKDAASQIGYPYQAVLDWRSARNTGTGKRAAGPRALAIARVVFGDQRRNPAKVLAEK